MGFYGLEIYGLNNFSIIYFFFRLYKFLLQVSLFLQLTIVLKLIHGNQHLETSKGA